MRNKIHINITFLYITIFGKDILKKEQNYHIVKAINRNSALFEPFEPFELFIFSIVNIYRRDFE